MAANLGAHPSRAPSFALKSCGLVWKSTAWTGNDLEAGSDRNRWRRHT